jgi:hypothetical protein
MIARPCSFPELDRIDMVEKRNKDGVRLSACYERSPAKPRKRPSTGAMEAIVSTPVGDDGLIFDVGTLTDRRALFSTAASLSRSSAPGSTTCVAFGRSMAN